MISTTEMVGDEDRVSTRGKNAQLPVAVEDGGLPTVIDVEHIAL
jgi:hypothetical protein